MSDAASGAISAGGTKRISAWSMSLGYAIAAMLIVACIQSEGIPFSACV